MEDYKMNYMTWYSSLIQSWMVMIMLMLPTSDMTTMKIAEELHEEILSGSHAKK